MFPFAHMGIPLIPFLAVRRDPLDYRLLLLGSLHPYIIHKPLGHLVLSENNGRIFAHTILFSVIVLILALRFRRLLPLSLGISFHQFLDLMYLDPEGALWPIAGPFRSTDFQLEQWFEAVLEPPVLAGEIIGIAAILLTAFYIGLQRPGALARLLRTGR
ncbi:MAG: hypothetical protein ACMUIG_04875 [Thermoplasmatota archaeon]